MDRDRENLWTRRTNKLSGQLAGSDHAENRSENSSRVFSGSKRFGGDGRASNPFNTISPLSTSGITSPTAGASSAFGLGSGAFASFGSASKTPKTPGTAFDFAAKPAPLTPLDKREKGASRAQSTSAKAGTGSVNEEASSSRPSTDLGTPWPLKYSWVIWYRPPTHKNADYEKSIRSMCRISTGQQFWQVYSHLKRPSALPTVSDYHFFRDGIRPVWEDDENKRGGKWTLKLKKGVSDRYWEELLMAMVGDQFAEAGDEVCGAVLSVRPGEDIFSVWTKVDGGRNVKIRETIKRVLALPPDTTISWKSHDDSIAQRNVQDQARQHGTDKRRVTMSNDDGLPAKEKPNGS